MPAQAAAAGAPAERRRLQGSGQQMNGHLGPKTCSEPNGPYAHLPLAARDSLSATRPRPPPPARPRDTVAPLPRRNEQEVEDCCNGIDKQADCVVAKLGTDDKKLACDWDPKEAAGQRCLARPQGISGGVIALFVVMGLLVVIPLLRKCCFGAKEMKAPLQPLQLQPATELSGSSQLYSPPPRT